MKMLFLSGIARASFVGPIERLAREGHELTILLEDESVATSVHPSLQNSCRVFEMHASSQGKWQRIGAAGRILLEKSVRSPRQAAELARVFDFKGLRQGVIRAILMAEHLKILSRVGRNFDIIHSRDGELGLRIAQLQHGGFLNGHHVCSFHGIDLMGISPERCREQYQLLFQTAAALTVQTEFMRELILEAGAPPNRVHIIPSAVEVMAIPYSGPNIPTNDEPIRLVSVGRLIDWKGHDDLVRAIRILREHETDVTLDVFGGGPLRSTLEKLAYDQGVHDAVTFHGAKPYLTVMKEMANAHIFVHSPKTVNGRATEAMGLVTLEAQLMGLPCVVTRSGGVPETVVENETALIVPENDPQAFAHAIMQMLSRSERWEESGRVGRDFVERNFSVDAVVSRYIDLYKSF